MALDITEAGLSLSRDHPGPDSAKPSQIMRLDLAQNTLDDLIQSLQSDKPARIRLGKHPTLYYGSKSQHFHSSPESHPSEFYSYSSTDKKLYFTGVLSHNLEVQKAKEATAATDQALATLEQSLNAFERGKESKQTHIITDIDELRALKAGDNRSSTGREAAGLARRPTSKVEIEKERLLKNAASRSVSSSPSLGLSRSPNLLPSAIPTSAPPSQNKAQIRLDALKIPFIHLLAVRPVSVKFLAQQTRSSLEDCQTFTQKYCTENRDDRSKLDLRDKAYRELDVWKFPYPSQDDRDQAIKNAISAFDRMRVSRTDKLWQMLLPKEERGKGKCLSRLDLRGGPIKKPATPRIQVQSEETKDGYSTGHETDKAGNGNALTPKSKPTQTKRAGEKDAAKRAPAKNKATNSTLTGRITKKTERKPAPKQDGKFKSAEYVQDSDDDLDMPDAAAGKPKQEKEAATQRKSQPEAQSKSQPKEPQPQSKPQPKAEGKSSGPNESKVTRVPAPKTNKSEPASRKPEPSQPANGLASKRPPPSHSSFPRKPSPLGSSPPTNASDIQTHSRSSSTSQTNPSSSSSSPLMTQVSKAKQSAGTASNAAKTGTAKPNGMVKSKPAETINPLKRKAEAERPSATNQATTRVNGTMDNKRRRAVSTSGSSTGSSSPSLSREVLLQQLREKSQVFKQYYTKYRALHDAMAAHSDPPMAELDRLQRQHSRLQQMKKEIWDEDRRLRGRI